MDANEKEAHAYFSQAMRALEKDSRPAAISMARIALAYIGYPVIRAGGAEAADAVSPGAVEAPGPYSDPRYAQARVLDRIEVESGSGSAVGASECSNLQASIANDHSRERGRDPARPPRSEPGISDPLPDSLRPYDRVNTDAEELAELKRLDRRQDGEDAL